MSVLRKVKFCDYKDDLQNLELLQNKRTMDGFSKLNSGEPPLIITSHCIGSIIIPYLRVVMYFIFRFI